MTYFTQGKAINFIESMFGEGRLSNQGLNISVVCPICKRQKHSTYSKKKLVIRTDNFLVHCWVCGYKSRNLLHLIKTFKSSYLNRYIEEFLNGKDISSFNKQEEKFKIVTLPESFQFLATAPQTPYVNRLRSYLIERGLKLEEDLWFWKIGYTTDIEDKRMKGRIIFPSFDAEGKLNYYVARHIRNFFPKYRNPDVNKDEVIFNELNIDWEKELTITEGIFDLIKCNDNATCLLGSELNHNHKLFEKIIVNKTPVLLALDPDAKKKTFRFAKFLHEFGIKVRILNVPKEYEDVGALPKNMFSLISDTAMLYDKESHLRERIASIV